MKKYTLFSQDRVNRGSKNGLYLSSDPGQFAAITTQKIVGRLDCHSGKRALPENRIFLRHLNDKPKDFRFCKICQPQILRVGDRLDYLEKRAEALEKKPHISLWALGRTIGDGTRYDPYRWYVAMNREGRSKEWFKNQVTLSDEHRYHRSFSLALEHGKRLNLPVIKHMVTDFVIIWLPKQKSTPEQTALVQGLWDKSITSIFRGKHQ